MNCDPSKLLGKEVRKQGDALGKVWAKVLELRFVATVKLTKGSVRGRFIWLTPRLRPSQREVRAGSEGRPACYLLTDPGSPDQGLALPIVGPPHINKQQSLLTDTPTGFPWLKLPFLLTLECVRLTVMLTGALADEEFWIVAWLQWPWAVKSILSTFSSSIWLSLLFLQSSICQYFSLTEATILRQCSQGVGLAVFSKRQKRLFLIPEGKSWN